ncbi:4a-hydroxytetrahydrobiopterin dehydratase [Marinimicrobium koreense]|jgi:4a-hydroxytetrahydrobiopterin dehydratase|uniref:4a-hydroxytetrahydrobiopterin dehydratase n=1 Tax=Marinimicrobium koreense TaxID=306545 RepID=UPI003F7263D5
MNDLAGQTCEACRSDAPRVSDAEVAELKTQVPDWQTLTVDDEQRLRRVFKFKNFAEALAFTQRVGDLAEEADHHPALLTEWGKVTVDWWTHKIGGLHRNDFIMAAKTDRVYSS